LVGVQVAPFGSCARYASALTRIKALVTADQSKDDLAGYLLRVIRHERLVTLAASVRCWRARPTGLSTTLALGPGGMVGDRIPVRHLYGFEHKVSVGPPAQAGARVGVQGAPDDQPWVRTNDPPPFGSRSPRYR
jgi:hypothetical protein